MKLMAISTIIPVLILASSAYGQKNEGLYSIWKMPCNSREGQTADGTGKMMITLKHFSRPHPRSDRRTFMVPKMGTRVIPGTGQ